MNPRSTIALILSRIAVVVTILTTVWVGSTAPGRAQNSLDPRNPIVLFAFNRAFDNFVQDYYKRPDPARAIAWFGRLDLRSLRRDSAATVHAPAMLIAFYAHVIKGRPNAGLALARAALRRRSSRSVSLAYGANYHAGNGNRDAVFRMLEAPMTAASRARVRRGYVGRRPMPYLRWVSNHSSRLDVFWAAFFASGDRRYIVKVAEAMDHWMPLPMLLRRIEAEKRRKRTLPRAQRKLSPAILRSIYAHVAHQFLRNNSARHPAIVPVLRRIAARSRGARGRGAKSVLRDLGMR